MLVEVAGGILLFWLMVNGGGDVGIASSGSSGSGRVSGSGRSIHNIGCGIKDDSSHNKNNKLGQSFKNSELPLIRKSLFPSPKKRFFTYTF